MNISRQERLECAHECNPYLIEVGETARFSWKDMNADLVAVAAVRAHLKKASELIRGMSDSLPEHDKEHAASVLEDYVHDELDGELFHTVEKYSKEASEELWSDA